MEISSNEWKDIVGVSASISTILQMLSPLPTCYYFIRKRSVGDMIVTPYVVALTSCVLWFSYGLIIEDKTVMLVNIIGAGLQLTYSMCYYIYCTKKAQVRKYLVLSLCIVASAFIYIQWETDFNRLKSLFGFLCSGMTILFFASPLANLHYIIKKWNSESLPKLLITATFVVSIQWTLYGYMINNVHILITNLLGALLSGLQVAVILIIPAESNSKLMSFNC